MNICFVCPIFFRYIRALGLVPENLFDVYLHSWVFLYNHQGPGISWFQTIDDILATFV